MTVLLLVIGLALAGAAASLAARAAAAPRLGADRRVGQIRAYGFGANEGQAELGSAPAAGLVRIAQALGRRVAGRFGAPDEARARKDLMEAGLFSMEPTTFLGYRVLSAAGLAGLLAWLTASAGSNPMFAVLIVGAGAAGGWFGPHALVRKTASRRFEEIERGLPDLVDLLVVTIEAGLGLSSAMQHAASRVEGPLGDEMRLTLQEQRMGLSATESLSNMLVRCETPSMRSFVRSILQGETLGVSIGTIMRNLGRDMRIRRRQGAEERAQKAPVKILFPLVFLIFPPMFIVLLYPALHNFSQTFGG
jgi:tight adherence protein C